MSARFKPQFDGRALFEIVDTSNPQTPLTHLQGPLKGQPLRYETLEGAEASCDVLNEIEMEKET